MIFCICRSNSMAFCSGFGCLNTSMDCLVILHCAGLQLHLIIMVCRMMHRHTHTILDTSSFMYFYIIKYECVVFHHRAGKNEWCCCCKMFHCERQFRFFASPNNLLTNECMPSLGPHPNTHTHRHIP